MIKQEKIGISSFGLHIVAMLTMLIDHMYQTLFNDKIWMNGIGRLSFPIFAFMVVEGYYNTKDVKKYLGRLLIFAFISEIPFDYYGIMGVPLTYLKYHNDDDFEIVGEANHGSDNEYDLFKPQINGKETFKRILIKRRERQR